MDTPVRPSRKIIRESIHGKFRVLNKRFMKGVKSLQGLYLNCIVGFLSHGHTSSLKFSVYCLTYQ